MVLWARRVPAQDIFILPALVSPVYNIFFLRRTLSFPIAQQTGQAVEPGHLSLNRYVSLVWPTFLIVRPLVRILL
jgi:hypothetical protein